MRLVQQHPQPPDTAAALTEPAARDRISQLVEDVPGQELRGGDLAAENLELIQVLVVQRL